jgi:hypothetical protein
MKFDSYAIAAALLLAASPLSTAQRGEMPNPDFTKGEEIPAGATHDWNLGATGLRGWMFSRKMSTTEARQVKVTAVAQGSPAAGTFEAGDVILGVGGKPFAHDPRTEFSMALTAAESNAGAGKLSLTRWRSGETDEVVLNLPVLGDYSATAPFDCPKSARILKLGCEALAERMRGADYARRQNPITRSFNALALLASGDDQYLPLIRREAARAAGFTTNNNQPWWYSGPLMLVSETISATGDKSTMPGLRRLALDAANGASWVGSWGHSYAGPDGRLIGYGMMNSTGVPLTIGLTLARAAGVDDPKVSEVIGKSANLIRFYAGKGAVPYGDHTPWTQTHEDNGKSGKAAVLFNLLDEPGPSGFFARMSLASHGNERDAGHTGNFFNMAWAMPAVALSGPQATGAWMKEFGAGYFDLARSHDLSFPHQGPPDKGNDKYHGWDASGAYLLAYAMPVKFIRLTGKHAAAIPPLDASMAAAVVMDGRGWTHIDRNSAYDALNPEMLFERLGSWSPVVRERAAMALARRGGLSVEALVKLLESGTPEQRHGACETLARLKEAATPAIPALRQTLRSKDLWLRVKAAEALAGIGRPAMETVPELLTMLACGPTQDDPRNMQQRHLCYVVFGQMLKNSLDGVDRGLLREAVAAGLANQDGRARSAIGTIYDQFTYEELKPLLPAIHGAIVKPAPSGIMFASGIRVAGLDLFAKHRIREGMALNAWGKNHRIMRCLEALERYGAAATEVLPQLRHLEQDLSKHKEAKMLAPHAEKTRQMIRKLEETTGTVELRSLSDPL